MKIMVGMGEYPADERERRRQAVVKCASAGTEIGFGVIKATFFVRANAQINALAAGPLVAEVAHKAAAKATMRCGGSLRYPRRWRRARKKLGPYSRRGRRTIGDAPRRTAQQPAGH